MAEVNRLNNEIGDHSFLRVYPTHRGVALVLHNSFKADKDIEVTLSPTERQDLIYALTQCKAKTFKLYGQSTEVTDGGDIRQS